MVLEYSPFLAESCTWHSSLAVRASELLACSLERSVQVYQVSQGLVSVTFWTNLPCFPLKGEEMAEMEETSLLTKCHVPSSPKRRGALACCGEMLKDKAQKLIRKLGS